MVSKEFIQFHAALRAMSEVIVEYTRGYTSEATQTLELEMYKLDEMMTPVEITADMVKQLRVLTGEGMMACNKALRQANGNMELALDIVKNSGNI